MPTALLSTFDKSGVADFARALSELGWSLLSSGGTAAALRSEGIEVTDVADLTGMPPILGHRVVTLHPKIHGGILAITSDSDHVSDLSTHEINPIDLVVVNLYPFTSDPGVELIDIGGPALVRAAAKNHDRVTVVVNPVDYESVLADLRERGEVSLDLRRRLARDAFAHTAAYDAAIVTWFDDEQPTDDELPRSLHFAFERGETLRYGENPHQRGARYRDVTRGQGDRGWFDTVAQHGGKPMSYLNVFDADAAWTLAHRFDQPAAVIVKHANPCGVAVSSDIADAYRKANACDPVSAFGGIVAVNRAVTRELAEALAPVFTEVVIAPSYADDALEILAARSNLRVLSGHPPFGTPLHARSIDGGLLVQDPDAINADRDSWRVVTRVQPSDEQWRELEFAWTVCAAVSSNAIVYTRDLQAVGIGAGQQNRVDSARIAGQRADGRARGGVCASDAFFPFRDGLDEAVAAGVAVVVQPGGSVRDEEVIAAADEAGIAMVFTGSRHFRH